MEQEEIRLKLAELGVVISRGHIPHFSTESPIQLDSLIAIGLCSIGAFTYAANLFLHYATVGRYCSIAPDVCIGLGNHRTDLFSTHPLAVKGGSQFSGHEHFTKMRKSLSKPTGAERGLPSTIIGNDVWIGRSALINDNVTIGDGAIIAAGAVVTRNIPSYAVAAGVPARIVRYRFDEALIDRFLRLSWWDFDLSSLDVILPEAEEFLKTMEGEKATGKLRILSPGTVNIWPE